MALTINEAAKELLNVWDENDPGYGNSRDDCCSDIYEKIEQLRSVMEEKNGIINK